MPIMTCILSGVELVASATLAIKAPQHPQAPAPVRMSRRQFPAVHMRMTQRLSAIWVQPGARCSTTTTGGATWCSD